MSGFLISAFRILVYPARVKELALENLALRQQLAVMKRQCPRPRLRATDRWFWVWLLRTWPNWRKAFAPGETRDRHWLASARIPPFLVLALQAKAVRSAGNESRTQGFGASDGGSQSPVGRTSHSWGANETGNRNLGTHYLPTNAQASEASFDRTARSGFILRTTWDTEEPNHEAFHH